MVAYVHNHGVDSPNYHNDNRKWTAAYVRSYEDMRYFSCPERTLEEYRYWWNGQQNWRNEDKEEEVRKEYGPL